MTEQSTSDEAALWAQVVESHQAWISALQRFFSPGVDRVDLIRGALRRGDIAAALAVAEFMEVPELQALFAQWVEWAAMSHCYAQAAREIVKLLPREWVLANIESAVEPILRDGTYDEYMLVLGLYEELDHDLARELALRAVAHSDGDVREIGSGYLESCEST